MEFCSIILMMTTMMMTKMMTMMWEDNILWKYTFLCDIDLGMKNVTNPKHRNLVAVKIVLIAVRFSIP